MPRSTSPRAPRASTSCAFPPGRCTRTLFGPIEIILWRRDELRFEVEVARIADSCGYAVPRFRFEAERSQLTEWANRKGAEGVRAYRAENNATSLDGLPGLEGKA